MADQTSVSPNPRPKFGMPLIAEWDSDQCHHVAHEHNLMVDEIELLSAYIVKLGGKPGDALAG